MNLPTVRGLHYTGEGGPANAIIATVTNATVTIKTMRFMRT
jgi:hypothetical protein